MAGSECPGGGGDEARRRALIRAWSVVLVLLVTGAGWSAAASDLPSGQHFIESHGGPAERQRFVEGLKSTGDSALFVDPEVVKNERREFMTTIRASKPPRRPLYEHWVDRIGANGVLDGIEAVWPKCHDEAHELGQVILSRVKDVGQALRVCADRCYSGCMHGVLMEAFSANRGARPEGAPNTAALIPMMHHLCYRDPQMVASYSPGDCAHGVGHALMFLMRYEISAAIAACEEFRERPMRYYCATGAYMEYVTERDREDANAKSLFHPCDTSAYPAACARYKMGHVARRHYLAGKSIDQLIEECRKLDGKYRLGCFHGLGNGHSVLIAFGRMSLAAVCLRGMPTEQTMCIEGAMERMAKYDPARAAQVCEALTGESRRTCVRAVGNGMYNLSKDLSLYLK